MTQIVRVVLEFEVSLIDQNPNIAIFESDVHEESIRLVEDQFGFVGHVFRRMCNKVNFKVVSISNADR